ncbi:hypothetical protein Tco_0586758, partial [Tanacetum coccineum]
LQDKESRAMMQSLERKKDSKARMKSSFLLTQETQLAHPVPLIYDGAHLDKDCPLNEEVKRVEEVKYKEFGRPFPNNGGNGGRYCVGPPGYYTRVENRPPFSERKPSLEDLMNKHIKESTRRINENEEWMKKLQETTYLNIRNQNAALKNLETQVKQLMKDFQEKAAKETHASIGHFKEFFTNNDSLSNKTASDGRAIKSLALPTTSERTKSRKLHSSMQY